MGLFGSSEKKGMGKVDSLIGSEASLRGNYNSKHTIHVDGEIHGNVTSEDGIIIGEKGTVRGNLSGRSILIGGKVRGNVTAYQRLELQSTAHLHGDVTTPAFVVEDGAVFEGQSLMAEAGKVVDLPKAARD